MKLFYIDCDTNKTEAIVNLLKIEPGVKIYRINALKHRKRIIFVVMDSETESVLRLKYTNEVLVQVKFQ